MSLFIFDKDGTLVKGSGMTDMKVRNPLKPEEQMLRMTVFEKIAELRSQGHLIAIATNQYRPTCAFHKQLCFRILITPEMNDN